MTVNNLYDRAFNLTLCGNCSVGKTNLFSKYISSAFTDVHVPTVGSELALKLLQSPNSSKTHKLVISDFSGDSRYEWGFMISCTRMQGIMFLFDITNRDSFKAVPYLLELASRKAPSNVQMMLVATKIDLAANRQVSYEEAKQLADQLGIPYVETSAKENIKVEEAFQQLLVNMEKTVKDDDNSAPNSNLPK